MLFKRRIMGLINILSVIPIPSFGNLGEVSLKHEWLCKIISSLINFVGDVGLGIILFTLILKLITLPLDIYSRASTKKNSLKMEMMKDDLEKLKKQYKNNEKLYQQKMMSLYKKNGYSAFSACLPTLVTLIFFIIVIGAFNNYSRFADKEVFNQMGRAYDACLDEFNKEEVLYREENKDSYYLNYNAAIKNGGYGEFFEGYEEGVISAQSIHSSSYSLKLEELTKEGNALVKKYPDIGSYLKNGYYDYSTVDGELYSILGSCIQDYIITAEFTLTDEQLSAYSKKEGNFYYIKNIEKFEKDFNSMYIDNTTFELLYDLALEEALIKESFEKNSNQFVCSKALELIGNDYLNEVVRPKAREASAKAYEENKSSSVIFPWVKNLWVVDSPFKYALPEISELKKSLGQENMGSLETEAVYNELTYNLKAKYQQKGFGKGNGLFILVALSILTMLGSTLIMNKQQKTQMQLSSVDGENSQAASTQKMMTWMMPIMFGIFAFIYSSAFSIYMITSSLLSTGFTLLINFFVERAFKKQIEEIEKQKAEKIKYGKRR